MLIDRSEDGRQKAMSIYNSLRQQGASAPIQWVALDIPLLISMKDARDTAVSMLGTELLNAEWRWYRYVIEYYTDLMGESELLNRAGPFSKGISMANFAVGMRALADRNSEKAAEHFRKVVAAGRVGWHVYHRSRLFIDRLEANPNWPDAPRRQ